MRPLTSAQRQFLKGLAHPLKPVVIIGSEGLTESVVAEVGRSLAHHELVKVKAASDQREQRGAWLESLCAALAAAPVGHIGKTLILYRPADKPRISLPR